MPRRPSLAAIFLTIFLDLLGFGLVIPFLAKEARDVFGTSELVATLLGSVYSLMQFLFVPVWGRLSDRVGRRPILVWSVLATSFTMAGLGLGLTFGGSVEWLFAARTFGGIATANLGTASAYIADITPPSERARGMGLIGAAFGLGFILGPAFGGWLASFPVNGHKGPLPCFLAAALSLVNFVWVLFGLAESLPPEKRNTTVRSMAPLNVEAAKRTFSLPGVGLAVLVNFLVITSFTNLDQTFTFFCGDVFGIDEKGTGFILAAVGVSAALVQGTLIRPLSKRFSDAALIRAGVILQALAFAGLVLAAASGRTLLYASSALLAVGNGLSQPATSAFVSKAAPATEQGTTLGVSQSLASLARTFGPALGGLLYGIAPKMPYVAASGGMVLAFLIAIGLGQSTKTQTS
jgi:MFS family permease